jgi:hypothetical protein
MVISIALILNELFLAIRNFLKYIFLGHTEYLLPSSLK